MKPSSLEYITVGQVLAPWGTGGKLKVEVITDFPHRLSLSSKLYVDRRRPMTVASAQRRKGQAIVKLELNKKAT